MSFFRRDIEGLRGIAILLVVAYHAGVPGFDGGFIGVDIFFVLSGYLITGLLVREIDGTGSVSLTDFYARRIRRLLPASLLMLAAVVVVGSVSLAPLEQERVARTALATSAYVSNWWFIHISADYFGGDMHANPLLHTWSLAVEEQFYLLWPVLILLFYRTRSRFLLATGMAMLAALSFAESWQLTQVRQPLAFFGAPARAWEFALGGLAVLMPTPLPGRIRTGTTLVGCLGAAILVLALATISDAAAYPGSHALLPVLGTVLLLVAHATPHAARTERVLHSSILQRLGQLSYGWYLWHWPAITFATALFPAGSITVRTLAVGVSLGLAAFSFRFVEQPIRHQPALILRARLAYAVMLAFTVTAAAASTAWLHFSQWLAQTPSQVAFTNAFERNSAIYHEGCHPPLHRPILKICSFGADDGRPVLVLFGDSHAAHWFPALERIAQEWNVRLLTMVRSSCPAASVSVYITAFGREYAECEQWREAALDEIARIRPAAVVLTSSQGYLTAATGEHPGQRLSIEQWQEGYHTTFARIAATGASSWFIRDTPRSDFDVLACLSRSAVPLRKLISGDSCTLQQAQALPAEIYRSVQVAAEGIGSVVRVDLSDQFCTDGVCRPVRDERIVYQDSEHLTEDYAAHLAPVLEERLRRGDPTNPIWSRRERTPHEAAHTIGGARSQRPMATVRS